MSQLSTVAYLLKLSTSKGYLKFLVRIRTKFFCIVMKILIENKRNYKYNEFTRSNFSD